jgi:hypothetical protein
MGCVFWYTPILGTQKIPDNRSMMLQGIAPLKIAYAFVWPFRDIFLHGDKGILCGTKI